MSTLAFILILSSALMHALWNLLVKCSRDKTIFIWWMFIASGGMFNILVWSLPAPFPSLTPQILALSAGGGGCFVLYHLLTGRAYRDGDLSMTYPLAQTATAYVPMWGVLLLGEELSVVGLGGIFLILVGVYSVQLRRPSLDDALRPLRNLRNPSVQAALAAGFVYSIGAVFDKRGVLSYPPFYFTYLLVMAMLLFMSLNLLRSRYRGRVLAEWQCSRPLILLSGPVMMGSFLTFRYALTITPLSYAVPARQVSLLFGILLGVYFLGESFGRIRFIAAMLVLAGVFLLRLG